jgi:endonuclease G
LEAFEFGEYKTYQVPVAKIEMLTGLDIGLLREHDPLATTAESASEARPVRGPADIIL